MNRSIAIFLILITTACSTSDKQSEQSSELTKKPEFRVTKEYSFQEIASFDSATLRLKRNEIFAQYGYKFKSTELSEYFELQDWYEPRYDNVDTFLTELDKQNISRLSNKERKMRNLQNFRCENFVNDSIFFLFNSNIAAVVDSIGTPERSFLHEDMTCPIGQLHYWTDKSKGIQLVILGDDYSGTTNYNASSRYYAFQNVKSNDFGNFSFEGVELGDSEEMLTKKLNCIIERNPLYKLEESTGQSIVEVHYVGEQSNHYLLSKKNLYIRFILGTNSKLKTIVFSTFNDHYAC